MHRPSPVTDDRYDQDMVPVLEAAIAHAVEQQARRELDAVDAGHRYLAPERRKRHLRLVQGRSR
jgi:hypothetical protein